MPARSCSADRRSGTRRFGEEHTFVEWSHTLGADVTAVAQAGLRITHLAEVAADTSAACPDAFVPWATSVQ
jgi:hypothetical protein